MTIQAVILAGGQGTRLKEITRRTPKPLLKVGGQSFIVHLIGELARFGFEDFVLLVGPYEDAFSAVLSGRMPAGTKLTLVPEPEPAGTAGALVHARDRLRSRFLLLNGDTFFDINYLTLTTKSSPGRWCVRIALRRVESASRYGTILLDRHLVKEFGEKSAAGPGLINGGIYWMKREIVEEIAEIPCSLETEVLPRLVERGLVHGRVFNGRFIDIGVPTDFNRAQTEVPKWRRRPAVFLDRDGVLNRDHGYVWRREDFDWLPGAKRAVRWLNDLGYFVFVVTNQAGIARGFYSNTDVERLHGWANAQLARSAAHVDRFYYCPHHPVAGTGPFTRACDCRKPNPGMLNKAFSEWPIEKEGSFLIGDKDTDIEAARRAGIPGILFEGGDLYQFVSEAVARTAKKRPAASATKRK